MKKILFPLLWLSLLTSSAHAERLLKPKYHAETEVTPPSEWHAPRLDLLVMTPLGREDLFDKRFSTFGLQVIYAYPLARVSPSLSLFLQTGLSLTMSRLQLSSTLSFTHMFIDVPIVAQLLIPIGATTAAEVFAGGYFRFMEYDSRDTPDGGLHGTSSTSRLLPEFGAGLLYRLSSSASLRLRASYLWLGLGISFDF